MIVNQWRTEAVNISYYENQLKSRVGIKLFGTLPRPLQTQKRHHKETQDEEHVMGNHRHCSSSWFTFGIKGSKLKNVKIYKMKFSDS